ncbi:MAG: hypothetical protein ABSG31_10515 [Tepidisphaeraceae bacterium]
MSETDKSSNPHPLDYAPARSNRRRLIMRSAGLLILIALTYSAWRWGPGVARQAEILYWQRQCMNYSPGPDVVAYEEDPTAAANLMKKGSDYLPYKIDRGPPTGATVNAATLQPKCWKDYFSFIPGAVALNLLFKESLLRPGTGAIIFMHERISPAGHRRLVWLRYAPDPATFCQRLVEGYNVDAETMTLATWKLTPTSQVNGYTTSIRGLHIPSTVPKVLIFVGQIDPRDASHFTIRYQMWGQEDVLDGYLCDNEYVNLTPRHPISEPRASDHSR